jgi:antitoxin YefM
VAQYQAMQEKIEMLEDIQTSISQLAEGKGLDHEVAGSMVRDSLKD